MTRSNALGGGIQSENIGARLRAMQMPSVVRAKPAQITSTTAPAAPLKTRHVVRFRPKLPIAKKQAAAAPSLAGKKKRLVLKVKVKSPLLKKRAA